jgi:hypothetical protein
LRATAVDEASDRSCLTDRSRIILVRMKLDSKYFDSIRIARRPEPEKPRRPAGACQWKGCSAAATHRAPKGKAGDGGHYRFCFDHVRQFNASYNYFEGMSTAEVEEFRKSAVTGHRPTWRMGDAAAEGGGASTAKGGRYARFAKFGAADAHGVMNDDPASGPGNPAPEKRRPLRTLERKALHALHLAESSSKEQIKARFKELVKRHHPDANGGDRGAEDKLREIIQAYNYLKQAGLV